MRAMAKLYFRYGTVGSAKTLNLLAVAHNYVQQDKRAFIIKPELDVRFGRDLVHSRAGVEKKADLLVGPETVIDAESGEDNPNGFVFPDASADDLVATVERALSLYRRSAEWRALQRNGMRQDFSWEHSARDYLTLYEQSLAERASH